MLTLNKTPGRDFAILNLTDPQLSDGEWDDGNEKGALLRKTVAELMERVKPDLVTVSGDIAWAGQMRSYENFAGLLDSYKTPWAPVWGNHDNQDGPEQTELQAALMTSHEYCLYEKGDPSLGNGNYVIRLAENGKTVYGVIMMDSHDRAPYTDENGKTSEDWAKLIPPQLDWYREQIKALGGVESCVILHIPIFAYRAAFEAAWNGKLDPKSVTPDESRDGKCWNDGYKDSFGVKYEGVCSYPADEGMFDAIKELGSTKIVLAGHDHVNNYVINYKGVRLAYSLKTGAGCYWDEKLNGGTVIRVSGGGAELEHVFVKP